MRVEGSMWRRRGGLSDEVRRIPQYPSITKGGKIERIEVDKKMRAGKKRRAILGRRCAVAATVGTKSLFFSSAVSGPLIVTAHQRYLIR